ncbi:MAG TPA: Maf family protein [Candidatus Paceibacterota bacterium]|nr:Maf family protein [Candidatus Paceibacterota bacterium]
MERPGGVNERPPTNTEKLLESWKTGPVILASGSRLKLENLRALGIPQATSTSVPEEVEERVFEAVEGRTMHMHEMVAAMVARNKVDYVIAQGVPNDALVCAFDTVVMETTGSLEKKRRRYLQKPESMEKAKENLTKYFSNLIEGKLWKDEVTADLIETAERMGKPEALESLLSVGYPQELIHITTGMAVRAPGKGEEVDMIPSTIRLKPNALYALASLPPLERRIRVSEIVDKTLSAMDENERWRAVTTGIDYSDPRIKDLLGLEEAKVFAEMDDTEVGVVQGMPQQAFDRYLKALAREAAEGN